MREGERERERERWKERRGGEGGNPTESGVEEETRQGEREKERQTEIEGGEDMREQGRKDGRRENKGLEVVYGKDRGYMERERKREIERGYRDKYIEGRDRPIPGGNKSTNANFSKFRFFYIFNT